MQLGVDFILNALAQEEIDHLFMVPGGLIDPKRPFGQLGIVPVDGKKGGAALQTLSLPRGQPVRHGYTRLLSAVRLDA